MTALDQWIEENNMTVLKAEINCIITSSFRSEQPNDVPDATNLIMTMIMNKLTTTPPIREFTSHDWTTVRGQGKIALVKIPIADSLPKHGEIIIIDHQKWRLRAVEYTMQGYDRGMHCGLVVAPLKANDEKA